MHLCVLNVGKAQTWFSNSFLPHLWSCALNCWRQNCYNKVPCNIFEADAKRWEYAQWRKDASAQQNGLFPEHRSKEFTIVVDIAGQAPACLTWSPERSISLHSVSERFHLLCWSLTVPSAHRPFFVELCDMTPVHNPADHSHKCSTHLFHFHRTKMIFVSTPPCGNTYYIRTVKQV